MMSNNAGGRLVWSSSIGVSNAGLSITIPVNCDYVIVYVVGSNVRCCLMKGYSIRLAGDRNNSYWLVNLSNNNTLSAHIDAKYDGAYIIIDCEAYKYD